RTATTCQSSSSQPPRAARMDSPDLLITGSNPALVSREQLADWVHRLLDLEDLLVGAPTRVAW
ncbi:MAG: hypothetical protein ACRDRB_12990, partial [Pseudonocardiaceae bacterium]